MFLVLTWTEARYGLIRTKTNSLPQIKVQLLGLNRLSYPVWQTPKCGPKVNDTTFFFFNTKFYIQVDKTNLKSIKNLAVFNHIPPNAYWMHCGDLESILAWLFCHSVSFWNEMKWILNESSIHRAGCENIPALHVFFPTRWFWTVWPLHHFASLLGGSWPVVTPVLWGHCPGRLLSAIGPLLHVLVS